MITDVEAYVGPRDTASHASRGRTPRNDPMFRRPGTWYVYYTYGMHWMLNVVTEREGYPAAILIRGVAGTSGPAGVTKFFRVDGRCNGKPASPTTGLWIEDRGVRIPSRAIRRTKRIGVDYAGPYREKLWRFHPVTTRTPHPLGRGGGRESKKFIGGPGFTPLEKSLTGRGPGCNGVHL